jgi:hypothetical protein
MKDEEMADKYAEEYVKHWIVGEDDNALMQEAYKDGFLAGLKAGRPQWHDLRKDKNDLPNGYRVVLNQVGIATQYDPNRGFLGFGGAGIIAWCERPTFDKE